MKKIAQAFSYLFLPAFTMVHPILISGQEIAFPGPNIQDFELAEYVSVGETGQLNSTKSDYKGVEIEYDLDLISATPDILQIHPDGTFEALKEGRAVIFWTASFTEETMENLKKHFPNDEFPLPDIGEYKTIYVSDQKPVYRLYNPNFGEHLFTSDKNEYAWLSGAGWIKESCRWLSNPDDSVTIYRLYNPNTGDHHYTADREEHSKLIAFGWKDEGAVFETAQLDDSSIPVYRLYNPNAKTGSHHFTTDRQERAHLIFSGWSDEGIAYYVHSLRTDQAQPPVPNNPE